VVFSSEHFTQCCTREKYEPAIEAPPVRSLSRRQGMTSPDPLRASVTDAANTPW
jgi:hypothetical protein